MCFLELPSSTAMKLKGDAKVKPMPRPYTTYNIFFQLEREYILQHDLGVNLKLSLEEMFHGSNENYEGPALPTKYQETVLRHDWFLPGKALRKKRQHRASHGKISFTDLSKRISASWRSCDDSVKLFCAQVTDIGMQKYKRRMYKIKKENVVIADKTTPSSRKPKPPSKPKKRLVPQPTVTPPPTTVTCTEIFPEIVPSSFDLPINLSLFPSELFSFLMDMTCEPCEEKKDQRSKSNVFGLVDMQDDEIFKIWMTTDVSLGL